ncbi:Sarcosine oxidase beta subunit [Caballeronia sordidicola]|uniref:Sarcosine oxidase beta subunit n=1 Tax=Caballeronia sordidicola TaxID=196367 RepID=A0A242N5E5_CABSO|nr:Sarcosine oxidase beta subunit [Caballeronia sordidicola]
MPGRGRCCLFNGCRSPSGRDGWLPRAG